MQPEALAMPADDGFGLDDDEGLSPSRPELRQEDPKGSVCFGDPGPGSLLSVGAELLTQSELNERLLAPASEEGRNAAKGDRREAE